MRNIHKKALLTLCLLPLNAIAQPSLCTREELTEWSCSAKGKIYSICSSKDLSATAGYMQYRAGKLSKTEFTFPEQLKHPKDIFRLNLLARGASFSFSNGAYEYNIYEPLGGPTLIDVSKGDNPLASITCSSATDTLTLTTTMNRFRLFGIYE